MGGYECMSFGSFSLRELTCMHSVYLRCEHARFCVEVFYALYINFHSFIHSNRDDDYVNDKIF